jgi:branched-subunit amino acid transport protein AzlD
MSPSRSPSPSRAPLPLRAVPFGMRVAMTQSVLLADVGRWMPLGAITILAVYCLSAIDVRAPQYGIGELVGVIATVVIHRWRRNAVVGLVGGTAAYLLMVNWLLPV